MNPVIKILCEGEKVCLGVFSIRGPEGGVRGYRSAGATTKAVMSMRSDGIIDKASISPGNMNVKAAKSNTGERTVILEGNGADVEDRADRVALAEEQLQSYFRLGLTKKIGEGGGYDT